MEKKIVDWTEIVDETLKALNESRVLLVSACRDKKPNAMAIGWGTIGIIWQKPVFMALVRPTRYTFDIINQSGDFTVNIAPEELKKTVLYCGDLSGRDHDKFQEKNLTALPSKHINSPIIRECIINFECRVIYKQDLAGTEIPAEIVSGLYPKKDFHRVFFGQILCCYT
ncbi:MAG: flavin reductase family protein [Actinobacteria bacterium]|nr:flavin reductase family protein [Actinomycetota bacterium]